MQFELRHKEKVNEIKKNKNHTEFITIMSHMNSTSKLTLTNILTYIKMYNVMHVLYI